MTLSDISGDALAEETCTPLLPQSEMAKDALDALPRRPAAIYPRDFGVKFFNLTPLGRTNPSVTRPRP